MKVLIIGSSSKVYQNLKNNEASASIKFFEISRSKSISLELLENNFFYDVVISFAYVVGSFNENKKYYQSLALKLKGKYNRFIYIGSPITEYSCFIQSDGNDYLSIKYKMKSWILRNIKHSEVLNVGYNYSVQPPPFLLLSFFNLKFFYCKSNTQIDILSGNISSLLTNKNALKLVLMSDIYPKGIYILNFVPTKIINFTSRVIIFYIKIYNILKRI